MKYFQNFFFRKKYFLLLLLIIFFVQSGRASLLFHDSIIYRKPYKLSEQQFLDKYGRDDSSRALIRYFFERRKASGKTFLISAISTAGFGLLFGLVVMDSRNNSGLQGLATGLLLLGGGVAAGLTALFSGAVWLKSSRRHLFKLICNYNAGKKIPKSITWRPLFKKFLEEERNRKQ